MLQQWPALAEYGVCGRQGCLVYVMLLFSRVVLQGADIVISLARWVSSYHAEVCGSMLAAMAGARWQHHHVPGLQLHLLPVWASQHQCCLSRCHAKYLVRCTVVVVIIEHTVGPGATPAILGECLFKSLRQVLRVSENLLIQQHR